MTAPIVPKGGRGVTFLSGIPGDGSFYHAVVEAFDKLPAKLQKQPPAQWAATLKSLTQKGVKKAELEDFKMLDRIEASNQRTLSREDVREILLKDAVTIKEVDNPEPKYRGFSFASGTNDVEYKEMLYILNSESDNAKDRLDEIAWELDDLSFDLDKLAQDPDLVFQLDEERDSILKTLPFIKDYKRHHWSGNEKFDNLFAHLRYTVSDGVFLINEIQSDWAQQGRRNNWQTIPQAPFVTDTKLWAQFCTHRALQIAASRDDVKAVSWIRGFHRNGQINGGNSDGLDEFYMKTVAGIVQKRMGDAGKIEMRNIVHAGRTIPDVPFVEMTDAVREKFKAPSPMYSLTRLNRENEGVMSAEQVAHIQRMAKQMLGSPMHVRCLRSVTNLETQNQVAGTYFRNLIRVNMRAKDPVFVFNHEAFHFAQENFLSKQEQEYLDRIFAADTGVNARVRNALLEMNNPEAAKQCANTRETQAHAFALWASGRMSLQEMQVPEPGFVKQLFNSVRNVLQDMAIWVNVFSEKEVKREKEPTVESIFQKLSGGHYAKEAARERFDQQYEQHQRDEGPQQPSPIRPKA